MPSTRSSERLGDAVGAGDLVPGAPRWQAKAAAITEAVLSRPLDLPPGQTLAGLVTTETHRDLDRRCPPPHAPRVAISGGERSAASHRNAVRPGRCGGADALAVGACRGAWWHGVDPEQLPRTTTVVAAVERFGWWDWDKPPRSEADVHQLSTLRDAANRLRLLRRRGRRLHLTTRGVELLASPDRLWGQVASETEDGEDFTRAVTELVGLRLLQGRVEQRKLVAEIAPILVAQGWSTGGSPITVNHVSSAVYRPLRWWRLFNTIDEVDATWEYGTGRELTPHTVAGRWRTMVLAFLRSRAAGS